MPFSRYPSGSCPCQVSLPFELRHFPAGSLSPLSRIEFVSYRLVVLLRLLPTPPHDDAVAVEYGPENVCPVGTFTLLFKCAYERTRRTLRGPNISPRYERTLLGPCKFAARRPLPLFARSHSLPAPTLCRLPLSVCLSYRPFGKPGVRSENVLSYVIRLSEASRAESFER